MLALPLLFLRHISSGGSQNGHLDPWSNYYSHSSGIRRKINTECDSRTKNVWASCTVFCQYFAILRRVSRPFLCSTE